MNKGFFSRVAGAVRMGYYEFVDPVDDDEVQRDEEDLEFFQAQYDDLLRHYEWEQGSTEQLRAEAKEFDDLLVEARFERDEWKRRYDDLLANVFAPVQEGEPLLLPADKLKPSGLESVFCPSVWIEPTEVPRQVTTGVYTAPQQSPESSKDIITKWLAEGALPAKKKAKKTPAKKSVKKAGK